MCPAKHVLSGVEGAQRREVREIILDRCYRLGIKGLNSDGTSRFPASTEVSCSSESERQEVSLWSPL